MPPLRISQPHEKSMGRMMSPSTSICRRCGGSLQRGLLFIEDTMTRVLNFFPFKPFALYRTSLYVSRQENDPDVVRFLQWPDTHVAYRCLGCDATVLTPHKDSASGPGGHLATSSNGRGWMTEEQ